MFLRRIEWPEVPTIHTRGGTSECRLSPVSLLAACQYAKEDTAAVGWVVAKGLFGNGGPS